MRIYKVGPGDGIDNIDNDNVNNDDNNSDDNNDNHNKLYDLPRNGRTSHLIYDKMIPSCFWRHRRHGT